VNILIVVIAVLGAPHLHVVLEWLFAGRLMYLWQLATTAASARTTGAAYSSLIVTQSLR
jgi:hypothetical protein